MLDIARQRMLCFVHTLARQRAHLAAGELRADDLLLVEHDPAFYIRAELLRFARKLRTVLLVVVLREAQNDHKE